MITTHSRDAVSQSVLMCTTTTLLSPSASHGASSTAPSSLLMVCHTQLSGSARGSCHLAEPH